MTLKDALIASKLSGDNGGGGGGADILIFYVYYNPNSPDTGTESGVYWNNATQAPYTFEEFSALYNSGTILFASFNGVLSMVGYDDGSESFYTSGDWYNWDTHQWLHVEVNLSAVDGYWCNSYTYN